MAAAKRALVDRLFPIPTPANDADAPGDSPFLAVMAVVCVAMIGHAIQLNRGLYDEGAIAYVTCGIVAAVLGFVAPRNAKLDEHARILLPGVMFAAVAYELGQLLGGNPLEYPQITTPGQVDAYHFGVATLAVLTVAAFSDWAWIQRYRGWLLAGAFAFMGAWVVDASPQPIVDVLVWHKEGIAALLRGENPYAITMPNIYGADENYPPGLAHDGRVFIGYVYTPINLLLCMLGSIFGDCRYALSGAIAAGTVLLVRAHRTAVAAGALGLLMLTPRSLFAIENAWIEPFAFMCLCGTLYLAAKHPRFLPVGLGCLLVCKQNMPVLAPLALLLPALRGPKQQTLKQVGMTVAIGSLLTLPFILWSPTDFWKSAVQLHFDNIQFRSDALTYLVYWNQHHGAHPSSAWSFVAAALAGAVVWWRAPRTSAGMCFGMGFVFLVLIAFNRLAYCNYYWLVMAFLTAGVAVSQLSTGNKVKQCGY